MVRRKLSLDSQEFYNKQITEFLQAESLRANNSLVQTLKSGEKKVYKKDVHEEYPKSKEFIAEMVNNHPELLALYKEIAQKTSAMSVFDEDAPSLSTICLGLADAIKGIKTGNKHADEYHRFVVGALTALFYPNLIQPRKEWEINDGRKRVDIVYTNAGETGFFSQRRNDRNVGANVVIVECKNYSSDVANQEVDQLLGRFDDNRGRLGILACRAVDDAPLLSKRCRDAAVRKQGFIIVLTDDDIEKMLRYKAALDDRSVEAILHEKFRALLA